MKPERIRHLADRAARLAGFRRATEIRFQRSRKYAAKVISAGKGKRIRGKYQPAYCIIAVPAAWQETETITLPAPEFDYERKRPTETEKRRFTRFRRLARHNDFKTSYRIAHGTEPEDVAALLDDFIAKGVLIGPHTRDQQKPKAKLPKPRGLFTREDT